MKFLLLLLPNFYDIFTLLMILYAFMLNQQSPLPVSFGIVCLLAYAATRIGIIAGKLVLTMIGQPPIGEDEEPADIIIKRLILGFGPQCIFVVICQIIFALGFLPHPNMETAQKPELLQPQAAKIQVQEPTVNSEMQPENIEPAVENTTAETDSEKPIVKMEQPPIPEPVPAVSKVSNKSKVSVSNKKKSTASSDYNTSSAVNTVAYAIPERTLKSAGVSQADIAVNSSRKAVSSASSAYNKPATSTAAQNKTSNNTNLNTKRYMGDDNPVSTSWGYYKKNSYPNVNNAAEQVNTVRSYTYNPTKY